jgi:hypothetical protein
MRRWIYIDVLHANVDLKSGRMTFASSAASSAGSAAFWAGSAPSILRVKAWSFWFLGWSFWFLGWTFWSGATPCARNSRCLAARPQPLDHHVVFWARLSGRARGAAIGASGRAAALRAEHAIHLVRAPTPLGRG